MAYIKTFKAIVRACTQHGGCWEWRDYNRLWQAEGKEQLSCDLFAPSCFGLPCNYRTFLFQVTERGCISFPLLLTC